MKLSHRGAALIESFEGFSSQPYRDAVGVWTIGYGSTRGVGPGTPAITRAAAEARLKREVDATYGAAINALGLPLNQHQFDALVSFVYNVGTGGVAATTGVGAALRAHDWQRAADELLRWDRAGGQVLAGLARRRQEERALFLRAVDPLWMLTSAERRGCDRYDKLHAIRHRTPAQQRELERVLADLQHRRKAIWTVAQKTGWTRRHRRDRYAKLLKRTR